MYINSSGKFTATLLASLVLAVGCAANPSSQSVDTTVTSDIQDSSAIATEVATTPNPCAGANPCAGPDTTVAVETIAPETQNIQYFADNSGLAIRGTDPVAYFTQGGPVAGSSEFTYTWNNATWQFVSAENRDLFAANPAQYAPQYGGYCAWAVSQGYTASIDPNAWKIVDGKLYLNYSRGVQRRWEQDIPGHISNANANWPGVLEES
ncbi:hypothetical protein D0962_01645 [Leptolyngbyaceae cyanobacterium CCMR0082]|uniref:YHS domain-containing protein n=1 Tax=Adonisia turfae CCMR0082 TaxID=2304604 RepID=A0A6M0RZ41_9CYAN|nr:YHS domain-containing (seleno)protein [Adonisia turfae]NEZ61489.1 hypothetical protein [Adonisia turfae CCMR0082]